MSINVFADREVPAIRTACVAFTVAFFLTALAPCRAVAGAGKVQFTAKVYQTTEPASGTNNVTIPVERVGGSDGKARVTAYLWPSAGKSTALLDIPRPYKGAPILQSQVLVWEDGEDGIRNATFTIASDFDYAHDAGVWSGDIVYAPQVEGTETLALGLFTRVGGIGFGSNKLATLEIEDLHAPDEGVFGFTQTRFAVRKDEPMVRVCVQRSGGSQGAVSVRYEVDGDVGKDQVSRTARTTLLNTATPDNDFTPVSGVLHWADGEEGVKTFAVPILNGSSPVQAEMRLSHPTGGVERHTLRFGIENTDRLYLRLKAERAP